MTKQPDDFKEQSPLRWVFRRELPLEEETTRFILVSALDVFLTYLLLAMFPGQIVESNPIAREIFHRWNIQGMIFFKFALVAVVTVIAQIIARTRLETGRKLLNFGTLLVLAVVAYSAVLLAGSAFHF